jgi:2-polyprenyl-3-methyl-5-hydroxy-6-metoxy-1,4-benzoquinol methylase
MIACDLCGFHQPKFILQSKTLDGPLVQCPSCHFYYVGSRRSHLTFGAGSAQAVADRVRQANRGFQNLRLEEEHRLALLNASWRLNIIREVCPSGRLLEVGCARGDFLSAARQYFDVKGVEPNPELAASARRVSSVHEGVIETLDAGEFDVAASFHVIEHVDSPRRFLAEIFRRVRPGGHIVIETPNIESLPFKVFRKRWRQFIPEHYYFFGPGTVRRLMESNGLEVERVVDIGKYASVELVLNRLSRYAGLASHVAGLARGLGLSRITFRLNPRDIMLVVARRTTG